jgi:hypothetical protein
VPGFRYVLELPDGDPADPMMFNTAVPDWKAGDEFLAGRKLQRFRILSIHPNMDEGKLEIWHAVWVVEQLPGCGPNTH